jgi:alpha/beta superfamily hydrolase
MPIMIPEQPVTLVAAGDIAIEARVAIPPTPTGGVAICHPHPLYGGDMENPVVVRAAEVCQAAGLATVRFNFRGVGSSGGEHDEGRGEQDDLRAAVKHLRTMLGPRPVAVAGYSFGAAIAARVALGDGAAGLALIAPALAVRGLDQLGELDKFDGPLLIAAGTNDSYCPADALTALASRVPRGVVRTVPGADHFFLGKLYPLGEMVGEWAARVAAGGAGPTE